MVNPKRLTLLAAAAVAAGLLLAQPARALTAIAQPYLISIDQGRGEAMQPIKHSRCHGYRDGGHGSYATADRGLIISRKGTRGPIHPRGGPATINRGADMSRARIVQRLNSREALRLSSAPI